MMEEKINNCNLIIEDAYNGLRIDKVISLLLEDETRSYIQKLIENEKVFINGNVLLKKNVKVKTGDVIDLLIPDPVSIDIEPENIPLDIIYEDDDVIVVNKEKGMVVHPAVGNYSHTLVNALMYLEKDNLSSINGVIRPGIVHRIDKDTSGILVVAKNDYTHNFLSKQLKDHSMKRVYKALVHNGFSENEGVIDKPIGRDPSNRLRYKVTNINAKNAVTHYRVLERLGEYTLIECILETGRTHQIRVHMKSINHPIVGDTLYGIKNSLGVEGQMLHAGVLGFIHPRTKEYMEFAVPIPSEFTKILERLRK